MGTNVGIALTVPLPRLEGVPIISGRANISYHAHFGPVAFFLNLQHRVITDTPQAAPQMLAPLSSGGGCAGANAIREEPEPTAESPGEGQWTIPDFDIVLMPSLSFSGHLPFLLSPNNLVAQSHSNTY